MFTLHSNLPCRRSPISIAAAVIYMITQLSEDKKPLKGLNTDPSRQLLPPSVCHCRRGSIINTVMRAICRYLLGHRSGRRHHQEFIQGPVPLRREAHPELVRQGGRPEEPVHTIGAESQPFLPFSRSFSCYITFEN
uniref:Uncharacterized protein n=1 Tax=Aegilops tauschii subsp. strangulata TaxID=200361 RepID=A0A453LFL5_AEGTS